MRGRLRRRRRRRLLLRLGRHLSRHRHRHLRMTGQEKAGTVAELAVRYDDKHLPWTAVLQLHAFIARQTRRYPFEYCE